MHEELRLGGVQMKSRVLIVCLIWQVCWQSS